MKKICHFFVYYDILRLVITLKALFKNKTTYSKEVYDKFLEFHRNKFGLRNKIYNILIIGIILACIIYLVAYHIYSSAIVFCIILVGFIVWRFFKPISDVAKEYKSNKIQNSTTYIFNFYDNYFTVQDKKNISKIKYHKLYRIFSTKDFFYLYIDKTYSYLIDKTGFIVGNPKDFYNFVKKRKSFLPFR